MEFLKKHASLLAGFFFFAFFVLSLVLAHAESTTMDEKAHIPSAYSYVRYGDMRLNPEHPPLLKDLAGLPLLAFQPDFPLAAKEWQTGINEQWVLGDKFINCASPAEVCNNPNLITFWSRLPMILITLLLGFFIYRWTRELAGALAGLFATVLYLFDPNVIAHGHYVTTDIGIAAFLFFSFYYFARFLKAPTGKNVVLSGLFLGLAQLAKFSAVLLFPIFGLFVVLYALSLPRTGAGNWFIEKLKLVWNYSWKFTAGVGLCFVLIYAVYAANNFAMPAEKLNEVARVMFPDHGLGPFAKSSVAAMSEISLLKPLAEYFLGVFMVFARVAGGNTYYFLGTVSNQASAWYFPVVFLLKETLPFLFLLVFTTLYSLYRIAQAFIQRNQGQSVGSLLTRSFHNKIVQYLSVFFILFYSYISITGNLNIGFRHLFPILPFLYMLIATVVFDFLKRREKKEITHALIALIIFGLALSHMAVSVLAYPSYLSYYNAIAGGHKNGYQYVTDSNYDWGQDVKRLRNFVRDFNQCKETGMGPAAVCALGKLPAIDKIRVDYFGGSSPQYYLGDKFVPWHDNNLPEAGWYALSINFLQESLHKNVAPGAGTYQWLANTAPVARAGDSIFIFYIP